MLHVKISGSVSSFTVLMIVGKESKTPFGEQPKD